jgi:hypothetical protein
MRWLGEQAQHHLESATAMNDEDALRISGDLLATTAAAIGSALAPVFPLAEIEVSTEVEIDSDVVGVAIYPDRKAPEGGNDFLLGGHLWLERDEAHALLDMMASALARANIAYVLELSRNGQPSEHREVRSDQPRPSRADTGRE